MLSDKEKDDLHRRMVNHGVVNDTAVVVVSARELQELLQYAKMWDGLKAWFAEGPAERQNYHSCSIEKMSQLEKEVPQ